MELQVKFKTIPSLMLSLLLTVIMPIEALASAGRCAQIFLETLPHDFVGVQERNYVLEGVSKDAANAAGANLAEMKAWAYERLSPEAYLNLGKALIPEAPEHVIYNWADAAMNLRNMTLGIKKSDLVNIFAKKKRAHIGIYGMSDPASAAHFGSVLMEVAIYKGTYPLQNSNGKIEHRPVENWQFSKDPSADAGAGIDGLLGPEFKTESYVLQDPRVIKQIRFPQKNIILGSWFKTDFRAKQAGYEQLMQVAQQWLLTPNYARTERSQILDRAPQKFIDFIDMSSQNRWNLGGDVIHQGPGISMLIYQGVLRTLFRTDAEVINFKDLYVRYDLLGEAWQKMSRQEKEILIQVRDGISESTLKRVLSFVTSKGTSNFSYEKQALIESVQAHDRANRVFAFYSKKVLKNDLQAIEDF